MGLFKQFKERFKQFKQFKEWFNSLRVSPWVFALVLSTLVGAALPIWPDGVGGSTSMLGYVVSWYGGVFQAISGALVGYWFARRVLKHKLAEIPDPRDRAIIGFGILVFCGLMAVAVCIAI